MGCIATLTLVSVCEINRETSQNTKKIVKHDKLKINNGQ